MTYFKIESGKNESQIALSQQTSMFVNNVSRLTITDSENVPKYMIHEGSFDKYLNSGGKLDDTLDVFITKQKDKNLEYGLNKGFVVVSEKDTLQDAKEKWIKINHAKIYLLQKMAILVSRWLVGYQMFACLSI